MSPLEQAAHAYITARYELRGATTGTILDAICRVDWAWHELTVAAGDHDPECCGCEEAAELEELQALARFAETQRAGIVDTEPL